MQGKLPELIDPKRLAHQGALLTGEVPAASLGRLAAAFDVRGNAQVDLQFGWSSGRRPQVSGEVSVAIASTCQRCLQEYETTLRAVVALEIGELGRDDEQAFELMLRSDEPLNLFELVEDELLLEAPMIPLHARGACTAPDGADPAPQQTDDAPPRAFADLQALWARSKKD